jgi:hypothetical protein
MPPAGVSAFWGRPAAKCAELVRAHCTKQPRHRRLPDTDAGPLRIAPLRFEISFTSPSPAR